jgi:hypothetical protein
MWSRSGPGWCCYRRASSHRASVEPSCRYTYYHPAGIPPRATLAMARRAIALLTVASLPLASAMSSCGSTRCHCPHPTHPTRPKHATPPTALSPLAVLAVLAVVCRACRARPTTPHHTGRARPTNHPRTAGSLLPTYCLLTAYLPPTYHLRTAYGYPAGAIAHRREISRGGHACALPLTCALDKVSHCQVDVSTSYSPLPLQCTCSVPAVGHGPRARLELGRQSIK